MPSDNIPTVFSVLTIYIYKHFNNLISRGGGPLSIVITLKTTCMCVYYYIILIFIWTFIFLNSLLLSLHLVIYSFSLI